jgi:hypothetical protein
MKRKASLKERIRYRFDNLFSKGTGTLIIALAILSLVIILLAAIIMLIGRIGPEDQSVAFLRRCGWV